MSWVRILATLVALYAVYAGLAFALQRDLIFAGRRRGDAPASPALPQGWERVWLELPAMPGVRVEALHGSALGTGAGAAAPALIFAHGNAELIDHWARPLSALRALGLVVLAVEYPGYGRSGGEPSERGLRSAMVAAHDWLSAREDVNASRIVAYGRSLGGAAACALSRERPLAGLLLQSTFTDLTPFVRGMGLPGWLLRDRFDNRAAVAAFDGPVLVIHGERDDLIPPRHGRALHRAARDGTLVTYPCAHNDCPPDIDAWARDVGEFLRAHRAL